MSTTGPLANLKREKGKSLITLLEDAGYEPRSYSGRGMFGKSCVSIHADRDSGITLWNLAQQLVDSGMPEPSTDQLGLGYVYYWPGYEWPGVS